MAKDDWRLCVDWLIRCQLLDEDHHLSKADGKLIEFVQLIKDGVLLCHLLNRLSPGSTDSKDYNHRPQMSQVCCCVAVVICMYCNCIV
ncbi:hypothetical protein HELRODRAFT_92916 [Helobdella robusta]|uniref:Calponin-homology (CH) domain-containing protein n=1 Tax=Helobdella robusta TaxID=6412 RepID=T1G8N6_HELRO|nr:hypothetical protein HELRODRAFT_92916 [Helobdella robusta]ESO09191.1 hypothetical protein HELRODRAFT_92916 [Helobdella robusta]